MDPEALCRISDEGGLDLSPHPSALLESLRSIGYTLETALADIIDNSIAAMASEISVRFLWNNGSPWIAVVDDGCGMTRDKLISAMRFGSRNPNESRDDTDLGRFGLGMKTASISQCRHLTVVSKSGNSVNACEWDLDKIATNNSDKWIAGLIDQEALSGDGLVKTLVDGFLEGKKSGTILVWRELDNSSIESGHSIAPTRFSEEMDSARKHLEMVFHRFISPDPGQKAIKMNFNGNSLEAFNPFGPAVPARQELPAQTVIIEGRRMTVQPYILPHQSKVPQSLYNQYAGEEGYLHNQGFYIYRSRRLILKATWFRLIKKEELNKLIRVKVDIPNSLDHLWKIDVKKSQASPPEAVKRELKNIIGKISGAGKQVFRRRATTLKNRNINTLWNREVSEGKIRYVVNDDHPLIKSFFENINEDQRSHLKIYLRLLNETFPFDMYYADAAGDNIEFEDICPDDEEIKRVALQMIKALQICGFKGQELRDQLQKTEAYPFPIDLIDKLLPS
jgi:hypothetical protein